MKKPIIGNDTGSLSKALSEISNRIYVNDGVLKDRLFIDICRLLATKMQAELDDSSKLLTPDFLKSLSPTQIDEWSVKLFEYGKTNGLEVADYANWNIKSESLHWAALKLSKFQLNEFTADVKGEAFQQLVVNNLRGDRGEYFTPEPLVSALSTIVDLKSESRVLDPACGSGGFLYGAFQKGAKAQNLYGIEFSQDVSLAAKLRIKILGGNPDQITCANAFLEIPKIENEFDVVLMNPPFGAKTKIESDAILSEFEIPYLNSIKKNTPRSVSPEILFLEVALKSLMPNGYMGTVLPDGVLQNSSYKHIREWLLEKAELISVISCPPSTFIPYGTGVKTSLLLMKKKPSKRLSNQVHFGISTKIGYDARGNRVYKFDSFVEKLSDEIFHPVIDEDLSELVSDIHKMFKRGAIPSNPKIRSIETNRLAERWDAEFYQEQDVEFIENMSDYPRLSAIADLKSQKVRLKELKGDQNYIAISDVDSRTSQIVNVQLLDAKALPSRASYMAREGDVITAISGGSTGTNKHASAIVSPEHDGSLISSGFALLRPAGVTSFQLLGFLRSNMFLRQVKRLRTGHAIPAVSPEALMSIYVPKLSDPIWNQWENSIRRMDDLARQLLIFADASREEAIKNDMN